MTAWPTPPPPKGTGQFTWEALAQDTGLTVPEVMDAIGELEAAGLLAVTRVRGVIVQLQARIP